MNAEYAALERYVDMTELLARVDNDHELLIELLTLFQEDFPRLRDALHVAVDTGNPNQVEKAAHTLKGMLANLSMKQADQLAARVELAARAGDVQEIQKATADFDREVTGLLAAVELFIAGRNP
jgi:HPt (histidine-containing phosphotransfer) domain-containing protein